MTDYNIPDSASVENLKDALEKSKFSDLIRSADEHHWEFVRIKMEEGTMEGVEAQKLLGLMCFVALCRKARAVAEKEEDPEEKEYYVQLTNQIADLCWRIRGIYITDTDQLYQKYEDQPKDTYLNGISDDSLEVLHHFGAEAPSLLNTYACAVEDALINAVERNRALQIEIAQLKGEPVPTFDKQDKDTSENRMAGVQMTQ